MKPKCNCRLKGSNGEHLLSCATISDATRKAVLDMRRLAEQRYHFDQAVVGSWYVYRAVPYRVLARDLPKREARLISNALNAYRKPRRSVV